jgi:hypothetical protein
MRKSELGKSFEKKWAKKARAKTTIASGSIWFDKEDCKNPEWLFQNKATFKDNFVLKLKDLTKLRNNAKKTERKWAFVIQFNSNNIHEESCYVIVPVKYVTGYEQILVSNCVYERAKKQIKLLNSNLDKYWLEDKRILINFLGFSDLLLVQNEVDFLKGIRGDILVCQK